MFLGSIIFNDLKLETNQIPVGRMIKQFVACSDNEITHSNNNIMMNLYVYTKQ